jgi:hypothetical protein
LPLNWLGDPAKVKLRYDWMSYQLGRDFCRYFNTWGWRTYPIWDYKPRKDEPPPFAFLAPGASTIPWSAQDRSLWMMWTPIVREV